MTDTGQVPGEGLPQDAGTVGRPGVPAPGAHTFPEASGGAADEDDLLLMPGAQGAWTEERPAQEPEGYVAEPGTPEASGAPGASGVSGVPGTPGPPGPSGAAAAPGAHGAPVYGSADGQAPDARPQGGPQAPAAAQSTGGQGFAPAAGGGAAQTNAAKETPARRPLHLGPPAPGAPAMPSPVRSLADRGPAGPPPERRSGPPTSGPEYLDVPRAVDPAVPGADPAASLPGPQLGEIPAQAATPWPQAPQPQPAETVVPQGRPAGATPATPDVEAFRAAQAAAGLQAAPVPQGAELLGVPEPAHAGAGAFPAAGLPGDAGQAYAGQMAEASQAPAPEAARLPVPGEGAEPAAGPQAHLGPVQYAGGEQTGGPGLPGGGAAVGEVAPEAVGVDPASGAATSDASGPSGPGEAAATGAEAGEPLPAGLNPQDPGPIGEFVPVDGVLPSTPHLAPTPPQPLQVPEDLVVPAEESAVRAESPSGPEQEAAAHVQQGAAQEQQAGAQAEVPAEVPAQDTAAQAPEPAAPNPQSPVPDAQAAATDPQAVAAGPQAAAPDPMSAASAPAAAGPAPEATVQAAATDVPAQDSAAPAADASVAAPDAAVAAQEQPEAELVAAPASAPAGEAVAPSEPDQATAAPAAQDQAPSVPTTQDQAPASPPAAEPGPDVATSVPAPREGELETAAEATESSQQQTQEQEGAEDPAAGTAPESGAEPQAVVDPQTTGQSAPTDHTAEAQLVTDPQAAPDPQATPGQPVTEEPTAEPQAAGEAVVMESVVEPEPGSEPTATPEAVVAANAAAEPAPADIAAESAAPATQPAPATQSTAPTQPASTPDTAPGAEGEQAVDAGAQAGPSGEPGGAGAGRTAEPAAAEPAVTEPASTEDATIPTAPQDDAPELLHFPAELDSPENMDVPEQPEAPQAEAPQAPEGPAAPGYAEAEREAVLRVMRERRDIRNGFRSDPIPHEVLLRVLEAAHTAPSVGHSQPWDFVVIRSAETRRTMHELAMRQREAYAKSLPKGRAKQFKELKIEAILETPVNIVVTADGTRGGRHTLGRHTQPQMAPYSSALAVENLWLAARAEGLGVGWVSFFDEREMVRTLGLPEHLDIVAYLCVGYVDEFPAEPELMQAGWSKRRPLSWVVHEETYGRRALPGEEPHDLLAETITNIRPLDAKALGEAWERQKRMTKPAGALGMLEIISAQLSGLSRMCPPPIPEPAAVAIFAGDHGVHAQGVTPWPQEVTGQMVANFLGGGAVCNAFANQVGAEVCVIDVGVASELPATPGLLPRKIRAGTSDMTTGPALSREEVKAAIEVGIETARDLVAAGNKALLTGEMGIANTTASAALISVFTGADPAEVTGRGTGINDETLARKTDVVRRALELHQPDPADPIGVLAAIGGLEHAAIVGLLLGGASLRTPVILDGVSAGAAALVARAIAPEVLAACIAGHRSAEPGHVAALNKLGLRPLVDLDLRLGEGTGALLALPVVQSAARAMHEVATFDSAGVTEK
ncbi:nicotinate-nucleotide--dimethylbenzimidazole phosphoribosyltransferase [Streptomyces sp. KLOTTS4A1]|uniref:nicotinate-nucleotide--dimethylbenzimidazole phosphoribosyltransferase n=1 Tax=Streptomyces sp. KLOTTS4A1 TaxID=3390996 RepID=UPI0039F50969